MANLPNRLDFRIPKNRPLTWQEMDDRSRFANEWVTPYDYKEGMVVLFDDSALPVGSTAGFLSYWRANVDHTSENSNANFSSLTVPSAMFNNVASETNPL